MSSLFQIEIPKRNTTCSALGERLLPGMEYYSLLVENDVQQMIRQDFCTSCWPQVVDSDAVLKSRGYWKSKIDLKKHEPVSSRSDKALNLLKELLQAAPLQEEEIFVLTVFLSHARKLILRQEFEKEGAKWGIYEIPRQDEFVTIKILPLGSIDTDLIQKILAEKLARSDAP